MFLSDSIPLPCTAWSTLEQAQHSPFSFLSAIHVSSSPKRLSFPTFAHSKAIVLSCLGPYLDRSIHSPIWYNTHFKINNRALFWKEWIDKGLLTPQHLMKDGSFMSFSELQSLHNISSQHASHYASLLDSFTSFYLSNTPAPVDTSNRPTFSPVSIDFSTQFKAATIYRLLIPSPVGRNKSLLELQWEQDLGLNLPILTWDRLWSNIHSTSRSASTTQTLYYFYNRLFFTPSVLFKFKLLDSPKCWSCSNTQGDYTHMFFVCPPVHTFWLRIWTKLNDILGSNVPFHRQHIFLGNLSPVWTDYKNEGNFINLLLAISLQIITTNWKDASQISYQAWWNLLCHHHRLDRAHATSTSLLIKRDLLWLPLTNFLSKQSV